MPLSAGETLGPYQILSPLGAGGMGEVYKAKDTRLDRTVAIKVLPSHLSDDARLKERFGREARAVSSLNHPHICTLHDIGSENGVDFMVMEHIEGETLAKRLRKSALPLDQALRHAIEIADALDKAHRQGVVHRDLKPGNIMLTKSGAKLLDFGLAKVAGSEAAAVDSALLTQQKSLTAEGSILGTFQYMAPEQLEGKEADHRTDIFAFGAVLYEMITGKRAFLGKSQASLIGAIMTSDPPAMSSLQRMTPPVLDHVVRTCLAKDPDTRWQSAGDIERELSWIASAGQKAERMDQPVRPSRRWLAPALGALVVGAILGAFLRPAPLPGTPPVTRFEVALPEGAVLQAATYTFTLSPDGNHLVYVAGDADGNQQLYLRSMNSLEARPLAGTEDARNPFFSPDSRWVGFYASGQLKKISIQGGTPAVICDVPQLLGGASWGADDVIVFSPVSNVGLLSVPASGGTPAVLTTPDSSKGEISHRWPYVLPEAKAVLFTAARGPNWDQWPIVARSLETGEERVVLEAGSYAHYSRTGHLLYVRDGTLMAVPFDLEGLEVAGEAVPVLEGVRMTGEGAAEYGVSDSGTLVYVPGPVGEIQRSLVFLDRNGTEEALATPVREYVANRPPRLSPDGQRIAVTIQDDEWDIWVYDMPGQRLTRLTFEGNNQFPVWTPDGSRIAFRATRGGFRNVWWMAADGSGPAEQLTTGQNLQTPSAWSPDGRVLLYDDTDPENSVDIWLVSLEDGRKEPFLQTRYQENRASFSPDGHWVVYQSDESGQPEIYVQPFPGPGRKWTISTEGGRNPIWAQNGELFYVSGTAMMVVDVQTQPTFRRGRPRALFDMPTSPLLPVFDVTLDGQRFLLIKPSETELPATSWNIVLNWDQELKRLVPTN